jgi:hypothetical protein
VWRKRYLLTGAAVAGALTVAAPAVSAGDSSTFTIPAPRVGQATVGVMTAKLTAPGGMKLGVPILSVKNLPQLGKGFGGVAIVQAPPPGASAAKVKIFFVLFMGNLSTAPASNIDLTISPKGSPHAADREETTNRMVNITRLQTCEWLKNWDGLFENGPTGSVKGLTYYLDQLVPKSDSGAEGFLDNMNSYLWKADSCPGQPEASDPGEK